MPQLRHLSIHLSKELNAVFAARNIEPPNYMFDYFAREFCPQKSDGFRKVVLELCGTESSVDCLLDILTVKRAIDVESIVGLAAQEQNARLLDIVVSELASLGERFGWDAQQASLSGERVRENGFVYRGQWMAKKRSPDRTRTAHLWVEYPSTIDIYLVIFDKLAGETRTLVCKGSGGFEFAKAACAELHWLDATHVKIMQGNQRDYWRYDCSERKLQFHFPRAENGDPHGEYDLACLYLEGRFVEKDHERGLEWLRRSASKGYKHAARRLASTTTSNEIS